MHLPKNEAWWGAVPAEEALDVEALISTLYEAVTFIKVASSTSIAETAEHNLANARSSLELVLRNLEVCLPLQTQAAKLGIS